jgi:hypothetical protein
MCRKNGANTIYTIAPAFSANLGKMLNAQTLVFPAHAAGIALHIQTGAKINEWHRSRPKEGP